LISFKENVIVNRYIYKIIYLNGGERYELLWLIIAVIHTTYIYTHNLSSCEKLKPEKPVTSVEHCTGNAEVNGSNPVQA